MSDNVAKPKHYTSSEIECIDAIEAALGPDGFRAYCIGNVIKYNWRHRLKNGGEDLRKAQVYQTWAAAGTAAQKPVAEQNTAQAAEAHKLEEYGHINGIGVILASRQFEVATAEPELNHAGGSLAE